MNQPTVIPDLSRQKIVVGVSGGIAAYKSADLVRRLRESGCQVRVVMTDGAQEFISPLTFQALSGNPVHTDLLDPQAEAAMGHIELARWADLILVAPTTANTLARLAAGLADDLLSTLCLATEAPIMLAPAMNRIMWANLATQHNVAQLKSRHYHIIGPDAGEQACGETGSGRMMEPVAIRERVAELFFGSYQSGPLRGTSVLVTAGPTREPIDPVRYLSNRSSGKMGFAVATAAANLGATVSLVAGPVHLQTPPSVERIDVVSAQDMYNAVMTRADSCDIFISVAAVADYRLNQIADQKIKKSNESLSLELVRNPDILASVAALESKPFCVGFAAETENVSHHARDKLKRKKLDMIAANHVAQENNAVFNTDTNALDVFLRNGDQVNIPANNKQSVADQLMALIAQTYNDK